MTENNEEKEEEEEEEEEEEGKIESSYCRWDKRNWRGAKWLNWVEKEGVWG